MPHPMPPPKPPAIVQPAPAQPSDPNDSFFAEIILEKNGRAYAFPVGVACRIDGLKAAHVLLSLPSHTSRLFIPCDGPGSVDQIADPAPPSPAVKKASK